MGLLRQVEDLLAGIGRGDGVLALPGCHRVVLFTVVVCVKELLEPLDEVEVVLESAFDQFLDRNDLKSQSRSDRSLLQRGGGGRPGGPTLSTFIRLKEAWSSLKL